MHRKVSFSSILVTQRGHILQKFGLALHIFFLNPVWFSFKRRNSSEKVFNLLFNTDVNKVVLYLWENDISILPRFLGKTSCKRFSPQIIFHCCSKSSINRNCCRNNGSSLHGTHDYGFFARDASTMGYWPVGEIMTSLLPFVTHMQKLSY